MDETKEPTPAWDAWAWTQDELPEDMDDAFSEACAGDETEAEAYAAFLRQFPHVLDNDQDYTAEEVRTIAWNAEAVMYDSWSTIADAWYYDHGGESTIMALHGVADDDEDDVLKVLIAKHGREIAAADTQHWFFETGLLTGGVVYCFKRP